MPRKRRSFPVPSQLGPVSGLTPIGVGAMGAVFRGRHTQMGIDVAVKVLNPKLGRKEPKTLKRFVREVRLLAAISDAHVVRIYDAGQEDKYTFMVMELVKGQSLDKILAEAPDKRLTSEAVAYYMREVALGLDAVHQCGVIHRDIKPDNIMVETSGQTKIADFGLARGQDNVQLTLSDEVVGTPEYMSPEIISHEDVDGRADLYSLGVTGFELITGETPFNKGNLLKIVQEHLKTVPPPVTLRNPDASPELAAVISKLLEKKREDRYANGRELAAALQPLAATSPPHRPTAESDRHQRVATRQALPSWEELFVIKLLMQHGIYPAQTLLDGLDAWRRLVEPVPFVTFLVQRAGLPPDTANQAIQAAKKGLRTLRDRIGFDLIRRSGLLNADQLTALVREIPQGLSLASALVQRRVISSADAEALTQQIDQSLSQAVNSCITTACQRNGVQQPAPLEELEGRLQSAQYARVYRTAAETLLQQIG